MSLLNWVLVATGSLFITLVLFIIYGYYEHKDHQDVNHPFEDQE